MAEVNVVAAQGIILAAVELHRPGLERWIALVAEEPLDKVFWWVLQDKWAGMVHTEAPRPPDTVAHPHKGKRCFYVIVIDEDCAYEAYLYLIGNGSFHMTLVQALRGAGLEDRRQLAERIRTK